jgi:hypothetical protein
MNPNFSDGLSDRPTVGDRILKMVTKQLLSHRKFSGLCAALGSSLPAVSAMIAALSSASAVAGGTGATSNGAGRTVKFRDGAALQQHRGTIIGSRHSSSCRGRCSGSRVPLMSITKPRPLLSRRLISDQPASR